MSATSVGIALPLSLLRSVEQMTFASAFSVLALTSNGRHRRR